MPPDIRLGNGQLLDNFDLECHLVDILFPYVGNENQNDGHICDLRTFRAGGSHRVRRQRLKESIDVPGNPWDLASLRGSRWCIARTTNREDLDDALDLARGSVEHAHPRGAMPEQVPPRIHALPLTGSHAFFVAAIRDRAEHLRALKAPE